MEKRYYWFVPLFSLLALVLAASIFSGCSKRNFSDNALSVEKRTCAQMNYVYPEVMDGAEAGFDYMPPADPQDTAFCSCKIDVGIETPLVAIYSHPDGYEQDVTDRVQWEVSDPSSAGIQPGGNLITDAPGEIDVTACWDDICSDPFELIAVEDAEVVALEIYPGYYYPMPLVDDFAIEELDCLDCYWYDTVRLLIGDTINFFALGISETGTYVDMTDEVEWHSSSPEVADLAADGLLTAFVEGFTKVSATYEELLSNEVDVEVLAEAVLTELWIYRQSMDGIIKVGGIDQFYATAFFDPWIVLDKTGEVEWIISDPGIGAIDAEGIFTALSPGIVTIKARYQGIDSNVIELEVWDEVIMEYCDPANPNRAFWEDEYNRVILETDCDSYGIPGEVFIRYTIEEKQAPPWGILDPCLDLVILKKVSGDVIKTLRFEGCGDLPLEGSAADLAYIEPLYQYATIWDMTDDNAHVAAPGSYTVAGRFYIYYDPVIKLDISLE